MSNNEKKIDRGLRKAGGAMGKLLQFFHIRPVQGGLEITDQLLRLAYFDGTVWQFRAVRIEPDVSEGGRLRMNLLSLRRSRRSVPRSPSLRIRRIR